jgi:wobble nucleotide-excising tRNase
MLKKVVSIRNVGRFINSALPPLPTCAKHTFILGDNAYGKTTICAILRSVATNDPALIVGRTRVAGSGPAKVELLFDDGLATFDNAAWNRSVPDIIVFDSAFIADNVFSGDAVDLAQRRNLYRVIIGRDGVALAVEEEQLAADSRTKASEAKAVERAIQSHVPRGMTLEDFVKLPRDADVDKSIAAQTKTVDALREAAKLNARPGLKEAPYPEPVSDLEALLAKTLDDIAEDAQIRIADHIRHHAMGDRGEAWLAEGLRHITDDECPFCGQSLRDLALVDAFRKVFGEEYGRLKAAVSEARSLVEGRFADRHIGTLETLFETNRGAAEFWSRYCWMPVAEPPDGALKAISGFRAEWLRLLDRKQASPQDAVALDDALRAARVNFEAGRAAIERYNAIVTEANQAHREEEGRSCRR